MIPDFRDLGRRATLAFYSEVVTDRYPVPEFGTGAAFEHALEALELPLRRYHICSH